ncbi:MAG: protein kinase [Myxococcaceae bacterium]
MQGALQPGARVGGRYVIEALIGKGGMGAVYQALHEELGRTVAVKVLLPGVAQNKELVARFFREARTAAAIHHPAIVEVFDVGRDGDLAYIVMEKLQGEELAERIRLGGPLGPRFVALLGVEIAEAISAAHARGVIHRDLKPHNVFLAERGADQEVVKVLDFGVAKLADGEADSAQLTKTGEVFGTPLYMPPEQLQARKDIDARADVYSIGVILYEALTGSPPYRADSYPALVLMIVDGKPKPLAEARPDLPPGLCAIVEKAMAANRDQRFPSAAALAAALFELANTLPPDPVVEARASAPTPVVAVPPGEPGMESTHPRPVVTPAQARYLLSVSKPITPAPSTPAPSVATGPLAVSPPARTLAGPRWVWIGSAVVLGICGALIATKLLREEPKVVAVPPPVVQPIAPTPAPVEKIEKIEKIELPIEKPVEASPLAPEPVKPTRPPVRPGNKANTHPNKPPDDAPPPLLPR